MVFNKLFGAKRKPFLELSKAPSKPVAVAPVRASETAEIKTPAVATATAPAPAPVAAPSDRLQTTAELLAAEQAADQANAKPAGPATFAAELLQPAAALPRNRRRPGVALADFKAIAKGLGRG